MEDILLIHVQIVQKEMVRSGVMENANGPMDSVNLKVCNPQSLKIQTYQFVDTRSKVAMYPDLSYDLM